MSRLRGVGNSTIRSGIHAKATGGIPYARRHLRRRSGEDLRRCTSTGRRRPRRTRRHRPRPAGTQRRGQDHRRTCPDHPAPAGQRAGCRGRHRRPAESRRRPPVDRPFRTVRGRRRIPHGAREPPDGRAALPDELTRREEAGRGAPGEVQPRRRGRPHREDVLRRHAPPPRPGGGARRLAAGDVHGRAHHRARPAEPAAAVGGHRGARRGRYDAAADHAVPGGGRPPRPRHLRHRPRQGHRPRHLRPAQGPYRRRARRGRRAPARPDRARPLGARHVRQGRDLRGRTHPQAHRPGHRRGQAARGGHPRPRHPRRGDRRHRPAPPHPRRRLHLAHRPRRRAGENGENASTEAAEGRKEDGQ